MEAETTRGNVIASHEYGEGKGRGRRRVDIASRGYVGRMPDFPIGPYIWSHPLTFSEGFRGSAPAHPSYISFVDVLPLPPSYPAPTRRVPRGGAASINRTDWGSGGDVRQGVRVEFV